jgi:hypothetical protein
MSVDHTAILKRHLATLAAAWATSSVAMPMIFIGCLAVDAIAMTTTASAHVKWFVPCQTSEDPLPLEAVFTPTFSLLSTLFVALFYLFCKIEHTAFGTFLTKLLDRLTGRLHERADVLLRAVAAISFSLLWADGRVILTPELKGSSVWLSAIQLLIPLYMFGRATLPGAAVAIVVLYCYGVATYGLFHMLDYPVYLGLAAYFALLGSCNAKLAAFRVDCLRWTVALSLMWPSMEKFVYPGWIAPIATAHPELTLSFDVATFITAAGMVEFGLALALFWTPLVRRFAALILALLLFAATFDFGKTDGIGHLMIIAILLAVFVDPGREQVRCRPARALLVSGAALPAAIFLYTGAHTLYYGSWHTALLPLAAAAVLLAVIVLSLRGLPHGPSRGTIDGRPWRSILDSSAAMPIAHSRRGMS